MEDREGSIWIGTRDQGVDRFSSAPSPFTIYRNEPGDPNSLDQNFAYSLLEDSQEIFWIGTANRLNRFDRKTGRRRSTGTIRRTPPASLPTGSLRWSRTVRDACGSPPLEEG